MTHLDSIRDFWNAKAHEDPYWFVSTYGKYGEGRDLESFWTSGSHIWTELKRATGYVPQLSHRVVEIGCGVGRLTRAIAPEVGHVDALDVSEEMLAIAKTASLANVTFFVGDGVSLQPLPDNWADLVLAYCVFQHLPSVYTLTRYLTEMVRVAKPDGMIAFTLTPRTWTVLLLPILRLRAYLRERLSNDGPRGLYRREWVGIRPSTRRVHNISPIHLNSSLFMEDKLLFFGSVHKNSSKSSTALL
jgi:SAM-dependent methyltransferase